MYTKENNGCITKKTKNLKINSTFLSNLVNDKKLEYTKKVSYNNTIKG